jgi:hypothetical protein
MKLTKREWTLGGIAAAIVLSASTFAGGKYLLNETVRPPLVKLICVTHDSLSKGDREIMLDAALQSIKAQSYTKALLYNPELRNIANDNWRDDSALYMRGRNGR